MPLHRVTKQLFKKKYKKSRPPSAGFCVKQGDTLMAQTTLHREGLTCQGCAGSVTKALQDPPAVTEVNIDLIAYGVSTATVTSNPTPSTQQLADAVTDAGYTVVE